MRLTSGRPFTVYSGAYTFSSVVQTPASCAGCERSMGRVFDDAESGYKWYLDASERARFSTPGPGEFGSSGRNFLTAPGFFNVDVAVLKRIALTELRDGMNLELRADVTNFTNSPSFDNPTAVITSTTFGRIRDSLTSASRKIQLGAKINF